MNIFIYDCELYCDACAPYAIDKLRAEFPEIMSPAERIEFEEIVKGNRHDNTSDPSDAPEHCASEEECVNCLDVDGNLVGAWLENPLTDEGVKYVKDVIKAKRGILWKFWREVYANQLRPKNKAGLKIFSGD